MGSPEVDSRLGERHSPLGRTQSKREVAGCQWAGRGGRGGVGRAVLRSQLSQDINWSCSTLQTHFRRPGARAIRHSSSLPTPHQGRTEPLGGP